MILTPIFLSRLGVGDAALTTAGDVELTAAGAGEALPVTAGVAVGTGVGERAALPESAGATEAAGLGDGTGVGLCARAESVSNAAAQVPSVHCRANFPEGFKFKLKCRFKRPLKTLYA